MDFELRHVPFYIFIHDWTINQPERALFFLTFIDLIDGGQVILLITILFYNFSGFPFLIK